MGLLAKFQVSDRDVAALSPGTSRDLPGAREIQPQAEYAHHDAEPPAGPQAQAGHGLELCVRPEWAAAKFRVMSPPWSQYGTKPEPHRGVPVP